MTTASQDKITVPGDDRLTKLNVSTKTPFWTKIPIIKELRVAVGWQKGMLITGLAITAFFLLVALFAPLIAPYGHAQIKAADGTSFPAQAAPSAEHIWGTTAAGFDVFSRVVWGARTAVIAIVVAVLLSIFAGVLLGLVSGYYGGWVDRILVMIADAVYSFPSLLLAILMAIMISHGQSGLWSGILASGISICGVSAAIATGSSIRARPVVPIMVSSLIVVFTCIEMLILPFIASHFLYSEPMVAGGWMGLAVKSDGGAIASGAIADSLIRARALELLGVHWEAGWVTMVTTTVKIFIDVFIGVWSLVLAWVWTAKFDKTNSGRTMNFGDVLARFPRFVLGYLLTFVIMLFICVNVEWQPLGKSVISTLGPLRTIFFTLTFFTIGMVSNFHKLMEEGIGRLAIVYVVCLFGFIIWLGLFISWLFFHGMTPPVIAG